MSVFTSGEKWKMKLLSGETSPADFTDELLNERVGMADAEMLDALLPMAELRAAQIEQSGGELDKEAERMLRLFHKPSQNQAVQDARATVEAVAHEHSELTTAIAGNWMGNILANRMVGQMETELQSTVDTYREQNKSRLFGDEQQQAVGR